MNDPLDPIEIRPVLYKEEEKEKKGGGFFLPLLQKLGLGGKSGAGFSAGATSWWGGLLATKAGLVGLILAGSTIAAGIGIVGTNYMSSSSNRPGVFSNIFPDFGSPGSPSAQGESRSGSADSLGYFSEANKGQVADTSEPGDAPAGGVPSSDSGAPTENPAAQSVGSNTQALVDGLKNKLASNPPPAPISFGGGGFTGGSGGGSMGGGSITSGDARGNRGSSSAMSATRATSGAGAGGRLFGHRGGAIGQAKAANIDGKFATKLTPAGSKSTSGATFDAGKTAGPIDAMGAIASGGLGTTGSGLASQFNPNTIAQTKDLPPAPKVDGAEPKAAGGKDVTPWKNLLYAAIGAMAASLLMIFMAGKTADSARLAPTPFEKAALFSKASSMAWIATLAAGIATALGVLIVAMYGQMTQGLMIAGIGGMLAYQAATTAIEGSKNSKVARTEMQAIEQAKRAEAAKALGVAENSLKPGTFSGNGITWVDPAKVGHAHTAPWEIRQVAADAGYNPGMFRMRGLGGGRFGMFG